MVGTVKRTRRWDGPSVGVATAMTTVRKTPVPAADGGVIVEIASPVGGGTAVAALLALALTARRGGAVIGTRLNTPLNGYPNTLLLLPGVRRIG
jgi:hypothetical protein